MEKEVGALATIHALHNAGYSCGTRAAAGFLDELPGKGTSSISDAELWRRLSDFFQRRGWGKLTHRDAHKAIGLLATRDWAEADGEHGNDEASCSFTTGLLSGLLSQLAGGSMAVLEVTCRSRGDGECTFVFGSGAVIHELYGNLVDGADLEGALASL